MGERKISYAEVAKHNKQQDCWVIIHNKVYDVSTYLPVHPGGTKIIMQFAGKDATPGYDNIHNKDIVKLLPPQCYLGELDTSSVPPPESTSSSSQSVPSSQSSPSVSATTPSSATPVQYTKPPLSHMINLLDFEYVAKRVMKKEAWDYYSSGADDEITLRENHSAFHRLWFRPRVLINVSVIDTRCTLLGSPSSFPVYITATALGKLAHPDGELALTRAAYNQGIIQMCPTLASYSLDEMMAAKQPGQVQWFQLYVNRDRKVTADIVKRAEQGGAKALFITVDAPQLGRREKDMRNKFTDDAPDVQKKDRVNRTQGTARAISSFIDPSLCWEDIKWFRSITSLPIVLKGIQCGEDAVKAVEYGVQGIVVSNHGGRQLDFARSAIEILPEVMDALKAIGAEKKLEIFVDGGIRRGTDIVKALALGARAVGIGRPVLYGLASYGQDGVERVLELLKDELEVAMRLVGAPTLADIKPEMICIKNISDHFVASPKDYLSADAYMPLSKF